MKSEMIIRITASVEVCSISAGPKQDPYLLFGLRGCRLTQRPDGMTDTSVNMLSGPSWDEFYTLQQQQGLVPSLCAASNLQSQKALLGSLLTSSTCFLNQGYRIKGPLTFAWKQLHVKVVNRKSQGVNTETAPACLSTLEAMWWSSDRKTQICAALCDSIDFRGMCLIVSTVSHQKHTSAAVTSTQESRLILQALCCKNRWFVLIYVTESMRKTPITVWQT